MQITVAVVVNILLENVPPKRPFQNARGIFGAVQGPLDDSNIPPKSTAPQFGNPEFKGTQKSDHMKEDSGNYSVWP